MILSPEQYNYLAQYENGLSTAIYEGYCRIGNRVILKEFSKIYKSIYNRESKIMTGCNNCILKDIKAIATIYFQDKQELETIAIQQNEETNIETIDNDMNFTGNLSLSSTTENNTEETTTNNNKPKRKYNRRKK